MTALTLGKFESLHRGHQQLIASVVKLAAENNLDAAAVAFDPHPRRVLYDPSYRPLLSTEERAYVLQKLGIGKFVSYPFDALFAKQAPEAFCARLFDELQAKILVVGEGYRFGHNRAGTVSLIQELAKPHGIQIQVCKHALDGQKKISTADIRAHIAAGSLTEANALLGFPFFIMGTVAHGKKIGHVLGFPTVNIQTAADKFLPTDGVYATTTHVGNTPLKSVTNIGVRPSVGIGNSRTVETFLLDFDGDLYGKTLRTEFFHFMRPERRFENMDALRAQISIDAGDRQCLPM